MPTLCETQVIRFGPFVLDLAARRIESAGERVWVTPKVFETLAYLVRHRDRVVPKEELLSAVWPDRHVEEANLTQTISVLRKSLGENRSGAKFIATFPGQGYRFIATVESETPQLAEPPAPAVRRHPAFTIAGIAVAVSLLAGAYFLSGSNGLGPIGRRMPVTRLEGLESQPSLAPDNRHVAFVWTAPGEPSRVVVQTVEGGGDPKPVSPVGFSASSPSWSPDGKRLAYLLETKEGVEIRIADWQIGKQETAGTVKIPQYGLTLRNLAWDPNGRFLLTGDQSAQGESVGLYLISLQTGERTRLTRPAGNAIGDFGARYSPDGSRIGFLRVGSRFRANLMMISASGGTPEVIADTGKLIGDFDWLPEGRAVIYSSNPAGDFELWKHTVGERAPRRVDGVSADEPIHVSMSRDSRMLVYSVIHRQLNIWRLGLEGHTPEWTKLIASTAQDTNPVYSPDGRFICFRSNRSGEDQLWVANADGSAARQLTSGSLRPSGQSWSPDGRRIVFNSNAPEAIRPHEISSEGGLARPLLASGQLGSMPRFSSDGRWIYFTTLSGEVNQIARIPATGGEPQQVTRNGGFFCNPAHDPRFLYLVKDRHSSTIWRIDVETGEETPIVNGLLPGNPGYWTVSREGIYFLGSDSERSPKLFFRSFRDNSDRPIAAIRSPVAPIGAAYLSLASDGRSLLCVRVDQADSDLIRVGLP